MGLGGMKNKKSPTAAAKVQAARPSESSGLICFLFFFFFLLLIIYKEDHPLSEPLPLFLQGQKV